MLQNLKQTGLHLAMALCTALIATPSHAQAPSSAQPRIVQIEPASEVPLPEQAVFALKLSKPLVGKPNALCDVYGIRSSIPTETITGDKRAAVLKAYGLAAQAGDERWIVLRCQVKFPDAATVVLRWLNPERPANAEERMGESWEGQRFRYNAKSDLQASIECSRSNADAGCSPLEPVQLAFTQRVITEQALNITLKDSKGKRYKAALPKETYVPRIEFANLPPKETLTVEWPAVLNTEKNQPLLSPTARQKPMTVVMGDNPPLVKFTANFGVAEKAIGGIVPLTVRAVEASGKDGQVKLRQLKLNDEASIIEAMQTLRRATQADNATFRGGENDNDSEPVERSKKTTLRYPFPYLEGKSAGDSRAASWLKSVKAASMQELPKQLDGQAFEVLGIPLKESGLYLLEAESIFLGRELMGKNRPMYVRSGALVTDLAVHLHVSENTAAVWVTQLSTGKAVPGAEVTIYDCNTKKISGGNNSNNSSLSNAQGWIQLDAAYNNNRYGCPLYAFAKKDGDISFVQSNWQQGIQSWRFEGLKNSYASTNKHSVHSVLARNLLKGGETLYAKHFWRTQNTKGEWTAPRKADLPTTISMVHEGSNERVTVPLAWDARGNAQTAYKIPEGAKRGAYYFDLGRADSGAKYRVEEFRLPTLKAEVVSPSTPTMVGEPFNVLMRLNYLAGGAAAGEKVSIAQRLLRHTPKFSSYDEFYFGTGSRWDEGDEGEEAIESSTVGDDAANTANAQATDDKAYTLNASGSLNLVSSVKKTNGQTKALLTEMEYRDPNGETYRAQGRTVVWPAAVVLGYKTDDWASGSTRKVDLIALTPEGKPAANAPIEVLGAFQGYVTHRRKTVGGYYGYHYEKRSDELSTICKGRSNAQGRYTCEFKPNLTEVDSGEYRLQASATDAKGRKSAVSTSLWLYAGEEVWFAQGDHDRMDVLPNKPSVKVGETVTLQVRSPFREATAWVNIMRSGVVIDTLVVPLSGKTPSITLPMKPSYAPNVFVNVMAVRGRVAEPAPTALVDLARPAFKLGIAHLDVASSERELKVSVSTDKAVYQSRETAIASIQVDAPAGKTMPADREVTVFAIDEALLELLPNNTWNALQTLMQQRGYGFESASMNMQVMGKRHYGRKALPAGGGGGKSGARELFETLLVWQGAVKLDAQGKAVVRIPVNDSMTKFRVVAVANAGVDFFGTGQSSFTATKDVQILSGLPLSAREGDQFAAGFTLRNTTATAMQVTATAKLGEQALPEQSVALAAGEAKIVSWVVIAPLDAKVLSWRIDVLSSTGQKDALIIKQPVTSSLTAQRYTVGAQALDGSLSWPVNPPQGTVAGKGELRVSLSPAYATDAAGIRDYMRSYPFFCLEQRTSKAVSLRDPALWAVISGSIDQYITDSGLVNYYPNQNGYDGGYDTLTAFVLSASHEARFKLPEEAQKKMVQGLIQFVSGKLERRFDYYDDGEYGLTERKLIALEAIARYQTVPGTLFESLKVKPADLGKMSNRAIVQWVELLNRIGVSAMVEPMPAALTELNRRLEKRADLSIFLKKLSADNRWYWMYSDEATAVRLALLALDVPALKDQADGLAKAALNTQRGGHWQPTQANVWGSLMLDKRAAQAAGGLTGNTVITVGDTTQSHDWDKRPAGGVYTFPSFANSNATTTTPASTNIPTSAAKIVDIKHTGTGKPYVQTHGVAWADIVKPVSNNASIKKTIRPLKQAVAGRYTVGDVLEVQVTFSIDDNMGWVAVTDSIPTGATLLGGGLKGLGTVENTTGDKAAARGNRRWSNREEPFEAYPSYIERTATVIRGYYDYFWYKNNTLTYQVRLNNAGTFKLPPTQIEAMYSANHYATQPNAVMVVEPAK